MSQLKPGDLALICGSKNNNLNGMTVRLVAFLGDVNGDSVTVGGVTWKVSARSKNRNELWHVVGENQKAKDVRGEIFDEFPCPAKYLMPLRGEPEPASQQQRELAHD